MIQYNIITGKTKTGPYDIVMIVRKIRNGSVTGDTLIQTSDSDIIKPAIEWAQLAEFFTETKDEWTESVAEGHLHHHNLLRTLSGGWRFLQRNHISSVFSGLLVLALIFMVAAIHLTMTPAFRIFAYMASVMVGHFLFSCYMLVILRTVRGQPVDGPYLQSKILPVIGQLLISSLLISFIAIIGLALLVTSNVVEVSVVGLVIITIGLFVLTIYAFAPLLILDQQYDFWDAMEASRKSVMKSGAENIGVLFGLFVINFIAGLAILLPMALTLPITTGALAEIYDEMFS